MARTTPVNAGYTVVNGITTGTNAVRVDTWLEYKVTVGPSNITLNAKVYAARKSNYSSTTAGTTGTGETTANGTRKNHTGVKYDFSTTTPILFSDDTYTFPLSTSTITLSGKWGSPSSYLSGGSIDRFEIQVYGNAMVRIFLSNEWKNAIPYIFANGEWRMLIPYLFAGGQWKQCA